MKRILSALLVVAVMSTMLCVNVFAVTTSPTTVSGGDYSATVIVEDKVHTDSVNSAATAPSVSVDNVAKTTMYKLGTMALNTRQNSQQWPMATGTANWKGTGFYEVTYDVEFTGVPAEGEEVAFFLNLKLDNTYILTGDAKIEYTEGKVNVKNVVEYTGSTAKVISYSKLESEAEYEENVVIEKAWSGANNTSLQMVPYFYQVLVTEGYDTNLGVIVSNLDVTEYYKGAELQEFATAYDRSESVDISYNIPRDYNNAKLLVGGKEFASFDASVNAAGSYKTTVALTDVDVWGTVDVELVVDGAVAKSSVLDIIYIPQKELVAYENFDGNSTNVWVATNDVVSITSKVEGGTDKAMYVAAPASSASYYYLTITLPTSDTVGDYVYEIVFDGATGEGTPSFGVNAKTSANEWYSTATVFDKWKNCPSTTGDTYRFVIDTDLSVKAYNSAGATIGYTPVMTPKTTPNAGNIKTINLFVRNGSSTTADFGSAWIDNVYVYRYEKEAKPAVSSVSVDRATKVVTVTFDRALAVETLEEGNVTIAGIGSTAIIDDTKKIITITPADVNALKDVRKGITFDKSLFGTAENMVISVVFDEIYGNVNIYETATKVNASIDVIADSAAQDLGNMYVALYRGNKLAGISVVALTSETAGKATYKTTVLPNAGETWDTVKVMVWDDNYSPIIAVVER